MKERFSLIDFINLDLKCIWGTPRNGIEYAPLEPKVPRIKI